MGNARCFPVAAATCLLVLVCCRKDDSPTSGPRPEGESAALVVFTGNHPLEYFAERIGGARVVVELPAPADVDPAFWTPRPETIARYQAADLIFLNGAGYERWTEQASLPGSRLVDTSAAFAADLIPIKGAVTHGHGPEGEHSHGGTAFTTWLDPTLAVEQARAVATALRARLPEFEASLRTRFEEMESELLELDGRMKAVFSGKSELPLLGSHPVYQYLRRRYELNLKSLHWEPDEAPSEEMWKELADLRAEHPARWMLWEGDPMRATRERLESMGVTCVVFDPAGNVPESGDFLTVMRANVERLEMALR